MNINEQMSDSIPVCFLLALSGGCMDAYSYLCRGEVFANAQTGNMLLFGLNITTLNWSEACKYGIPVLVFVLGIIISDLIRKKTVNSGIHWRETIVFWEIIVLFIVCWMNQNMNDLANCLISFACGMQVESFRSVNGNAIATTMCIGNLRSGTHFLVKYFSGFDKHDLVKVAIYYSTILFFILGAVLESLMLRWLNEFALILSVVLLIAVLLLMHLQKTSDDKKAVVK